MAKAGAGHATTADPDAAPAPRPPWWKRVNVAILGAGALAGAILAIVALVALLVPDDEPDPENSARFTGVNVVPSVPLSEYRQRTTLAPLGPAAEAAGPTAAPELRPASAAGGGQTAPPTTTPAPGTSRGSSTTTGPSTTAARSTSSVRTSTTRATTTTSGPPPSTGGPSTSGEPVVDPSGSDWVNDGGSGGGGDQGRTPSTIFSSVCAASACPESADDLESMIVANSVDVDGNPVPPDVAAERVLEILRNARTDGDEPLGVVVTTDVELVGLRDAPVFLTWEMFQYGGSTRLHGEWLNENLAYRLEPTTDHDTATLDLWIPLPPDPGPYVVRIKVAHAGSGLASAHTGPFG
jgi:hypothetical protein